MKIEDEKFQLTTMTIIRETIIPHLPHPKESKIEKSNLIFRKPRKWTWLEKTEKWNFDPSQRHTHESSWWAGSSSFRTKLWFLCLLPNKLGASTFANKLIKIEKSNKAYLYLKEQFYEIISIFFFSSAIRHQFRCNSRQFLFILSIVMRGRGRDYFNHVNSLLRTPQSTRIF